MQDLAQVLAQVLPALAKVLALVLAQALLALDLNAGGEVVGACVRSSLRRVRMNLANYDRIEQMAN